MSSKPPVEVKKIHVDVEATMTQSGDVRFQCRWKNDGSNDWECGPIELPRGPEHYRLIFDLDDKSDRGLEFYERPEDAIYVKVGSCPTEAGDGDGQIAFECVDVNKKKLTIKDFNQDPPRDLHYMLRFTGNQHGACPPYEHDPEIINKGGGTVE
ncbi:MAG TPA: hypothetical protein VNI79_07590 [Sphingomicrobium sp.]|nr:hypothetical protein [Sphingomicrobium sp.]